MKKDRFRVISKIKKIVGRVTEEPVETDLTEYWEMVQKIKAFRFASLPQRELAERSAVLRASARPALPEHLLPEAFALVNEFSPRAVGLRPFDVQIIAGLAMARGKIAQLPTGEGKTLAAVFPVFLFALSGRGVHVLTFNDYLARRDAAWMGPIYRLLGLAVGCVQEGMSLEDKARAYACDVTYATAKEAGFDFLRDQIAHSAQGRVQRPFQAAIVDEADSILIDEARIPLVLAGISDRAVWDSQRLAALIKSLTPGQDYTTDAEHRNVFLTDRGISRAEGSLRCGSLYDPSNQRLLEAVYCGLHAEALLRRDVDYIVREGRIEIVDEFTGRVVENRHWPDGLQAAVEAKENLGRKSEGRILGSITLQQFLRLYPKLCGMTATARPATAEFKEFYGLNISVIPPNKPSIRIDYPDVVFTDREAKQRALVSEICRAHATGRPVLVGTASIRESEALAGELRNAGVVCSVLNAKNDELEARIIAQAGMPGEVTISTNMAGRGTDIKLGGEDERERDKVVSLGGLYVIGTNRHESLRIDDQLRGRAGRQGDPGSTRFFISLEDDLFERYGLRRMFYERHRLRLQTEALADGAVQREIDRAQRIIEGQNFDIRKSLWKYSLLVETQRRIVQDWRDDVLQANGPGILSSKAPDIYRTAASRFGRQPIDDIEQRLTLLQIDRCWADYLAWINELREGIHLVSLGGMNPLLEFQKSATAEFLKIQEKVESSVIKAAQSLMTREDVTSSCLEEIKGPSSTWTYLVNEDQFGWGIELLKSQNIGFAVGAAIYTGPLMLIRLMLDRILNRKRELKG